VEVGKRVCWDVVSGQQVIGTKYGEIIARDGNHLVVRGERSPGDTSSPFVIRTISDVRLAA
jgi:hypothetical protein